jgi:hypothetical protein
MQKFGTGAVDPVDPQDPQGVAVPEGVTREASTEGDQQALQAENDQADQPPQSSEQTES